MFLFFFFNDTATTEIYTLSLHDALPIYPGILRKQGFKLIPRCTYLFEDISNPEQVVAGFDKSKKRNLKKAQKSYTVKRNMPPATFFELHKKNLRSEERRVGKECRSRWSPYH